MYLGVHLISEANKLADQVNGLLGLYKPITSDLVSTQGIL